MPEYRRKNHFGLNVSPIRYFVGLCLIFFASRIIFYTLDVHMREETLWSHWQIIDLHLLRSRLIESLLHHHFQPPLFNLLIGLTTKIFPNSEATVFQWLYWMFGFTQVVLLFGLLIALRCSGIVSFVLTTLYAVSPSHLSACFRIPFPGT